MVNFLLKKNTKNCLFGQFNLFLKKKMPKFCQKYRKMPFFGKINGFFEEKNNKKFPFSVFLEHFWAVSWIF